MFGEIWEEIRRWLVARPIVLKTKPEICSQKFFQTGPELVNRIVRAINLDQSVILTGPRGCGKSWCINEAIRQAGIQKIIPPGAMIFAQGNREIPRDYMSEDEIIFKMKENQVIPSKRSAPLFRFVKRDLVTQEPLKDKSNWAILQEIDGQPCHRFVLFLDEINRFSDGVLDSLLSILEERKAVLSGDQYFLPVVVCMTMNPPGYDSSARKLSPPLAARIGRSYRLKNPDINTLSDIIVSSKLAQMKEKYKDAEGKGEVFPEVSHILIRKAALVTLCLWGDVTMPKAGIEYLTDGTKKLLYKVMQLDNVVRNNMKIISTLCHYGPDARAVWDWLITSIGITMQEASETGVKEIKLTEDHLIKTAVESISHKIYDNFSPATQPELIALKEKAIEELASRI